MSGFRLEDGGLALFFSARMIGDSVCAEGLRMLEGSRHSVASFALFTLSGKLLERNAAFIREFGEEPAADADQFLTLFVDRDEGDRVRSEIVTKARFRGRLRVRAGREERWHMLLAITILDPVDGQRVIHTELIDITDQVEAEQRASAAEKLLQGAADEFAHPVAFVGVDKSRTRPGAS